MAAYGWDFDRASRQTQFTSLTDGAAVYTHDDTDQLSGADYDYQADETYTYDDNGNRTNGGYATGDNNRLLSDGVFRYAYDNEGNRTARFVDVDQSGTLTAGDTSVTQYAWDYRNRLETVTDRAVEGGAPTQVVSYAYDTSNRMVARGLDADGDGPGAESSGDTVLN